MTPLRPPRLPARLLARVLSDDPAGPAILGDLHEAFVDEARRRGRLVAGVWYTAEAVALAASRGLRASRPPSASPSSGPAAMMQDLTYALRSLRRHPGFALFTGFVIALGIGATTAVFGIVKPLALDPLPFAEPHELVRIDNEGEDRTNLSAVTSRIVNLVDFRERASSFEAITAYNAFFEQRAYTLGGEEGPERIVGVDVAADFLDVLGVIPSHGRGFTDEEGLEGAPPTAILVHDMWRTRFGADPGIVGSTVLIDGQATEVVGVLPPSFDFATVFTPGVEVDFLRPIPIVRETDFHGNVLVMVGRLRNGATAASAQAELDAVLVALAEEEPDRWGLGARVTPLAEHVTGPFRAGLLLLVAAAGTVLAIVAVNVSNLFLARMPGRVREVAVRRAMGASRLRVVRQLVAEAVVIALGGALAGGVLAWGVTRALSGTAAVQIPLLDRVGIDGTALLFGALVATVTGVAVGFVPALKVSEGGEHEALRAGGRGGSVGRDARRLRESLVVAEVALACVLLVVGGLLLRSFQAVMDVDLGFEVENRVAWQLDPSMSFGSLQEESDFFQAVADRVALAPGIAAAGLNDALPLGRNRAWGYRVADMPLEGQEDNDNIFPHIVSPGYRAAMDIPLVAGRDFTRDDDRESVYAVLLNETAARRMFDTDDPERALGRTLRFWGPWEWQVVGVVADVRHVTLESGSGLQVYFPIAQMSDFRTLDLVVHSERSAEQIAPIVAGVIREIDPLMPTREWWTMESRVERSVSARSFVLRVLGAYGLVALFLAGLGIYGVLAQSVADRRAEIGIRMALGASARGVMADVVRRTLVLTAVGVAVGTVLSLLGGRALGSLLFDIGPVDPLTLAAMAGALTAVALLAAVIPARRASRMQGVRALRSE